MVVGNQSDTMKILFFSCLLIICSSFFIQGNPEPILWRKRGLLWKNFQGRVDSVGPLAGALAVTNSRLEQYYYRVGDEIHFVIAAWFYPNRSWVKKIVLNSRRSDEVLSHEQHHFDLCELYARKIRKYLGTVVFTDQTYQTEIAELFKKFHEEYRLEQNKYDAELNNHVYRLDEWTDSIDAEMKQLKNYSDTSLVVKLR